MYFTADIVFPVTSGPIRNGYVRCDDEARILSVGEFTDAIRDEAREAQEPVVSNRGFLVPGFCNAHCHAELSYMKGTCHFTMGASVIPPLYLNVIVHGSIMQYYLDSNHSQNIPCVNISSVVVTNPQGLIYITSNASPGDEINISSLSRGYYILSVVANGSTYSKIFYKR